MKEMIGLTIALMVALVAGCLSPQTSTEDAEAKLCADLARLDQAVANLQSININSTVGEFRDAKEEYNDALAAVRTDAANVAEARLDELNQANEDLENSIEGVPDTSTIREAVPTLIEKVVAVRTAERNLRDDLNCPQG